MSSILFVRLFSVLLLLLGNLARVLPKCPIDMVEALRYFMFEASRSDCVPTVPIQRAHETSTDQVDYDVSQPAITHHFSTLHRARTRTRLKMMMKKMGFLIKFRGSRECFVQTAIKAG